jgi:hypothetical protein
MFDAHVNTAVAATQNYLKSIGKDCSFEQAARLFRNAASVWSDFPNGYEEKGI